MQTEKNHYFCELKVGELTSSADMLLLNSFQTVPEPG